MEDAIRVIRRAVLSLAGGVLLVCGGQDSDELWNGPFSSGRRSEQDTALATGKYEK
jgi:hypothetical protein